VEGRKRKECGGYEPDVFVPELCSNIIDDRDCQNAKERRKEPKHELTLPEDEHRVLQPIEERRVELPASNALPDADERLPGERECRGFIEPERVSGEVIEPKEGPDKRQPDKDLNVAVILDGRYGSVERKRI
jgi:hypothetical protein